MLVRRFGIAAVRSLATALVSSLALAWLSAGCAVPAVDYVGKTCEATADCPGGLVCDPETWTCQITAGGPGDASVESGDAGASDNDAGAPDAATTVEDTGALPGRDAGPADAGARHDASVAGPDAAGPGADAGAAPPDAEAEWPDAGPGDPEGSLPDQCSDGVDNDGDGVADCLAPGCLGKACRPSLGDCDPAEFCDGAAVECPDDVRFDALTVCRPAAGVCDLAERCDGASVACPEDLKAGAETTCRASGGVCDLAEVCDGFSADCPADLKAAGTVCRGPAGPCDVPETCDGVANGCPGDVFASGGICRLASLGSCDSSEYCTGAGPNCPADGFLPAGTVCRAFAGGCDQEETCAGGTPACPPDVTSCPSGQYCAGTCQPLKGLGAACASGVECQSGQCFDGICCNRACGGGCEACAAGGSCTPRGQYTDPEGACGTLTCDGWGACLTACTGLNTGCKAGHWCSNGTCVGAQVNGQPCADPLQCKSGYCVDGVCCGSACTGPCRTCNQSPTNRGTCVGLTSDDPACGLYQCNGLSGCFTTCSGCDINCTAAGYCSSGACKPLLANGKPCTAACQCQSNVCVDGVCCNTSCTGPCRACNLLGRVGSCANQQEFTDPENGCGNYYCNGAGSCFTSSSCGGGNCGTPECKWACGSGGCQAGLPSGAGCAPTIPCACISGVCSSTIPWVCK